MRQPSPARVAAAFRTKQLKYAPRGGFKIDSNTQEFQRFSPVELMYVAELMQADGWPVKVGKPGVVGRYAYWEYLSREKLLYEDRAPVEDAWYVMFESGEKAVKAVGELRTMTAHPDYEKLVNPWSRNINYDYNDGRATRAPEFWQNLSRRDQLVLVNLGMATLEGGGTRKALERGGDLSH